MFTPVIASSYPQSHPFLQSFTVHSNPPYTPNQPSPLRASRDANLMPQVDNTNTAIKDGVFTLKQRSLPNPIAHLSRLVSAKKVSRNAAHRERATDRRADAHLDERYDQVSRMEWIREQRKWEERMRKWGQMEMVNDESELEDMGGNEEMGDTIEPNPDTREEQVSVPPDEEELDALLKYLDSDNETIHGSFNKVEALGKQRLDDQSPPEASLNSASRRLSQTYGSDEDDYDELFMEVIRSSQSENDEVPRTQADEAMDMS